MTEIVKTHIHVRDQSGNPVSCRVNIPGAIHPDTRSTGSDGTAIFRLEEGEFYVASVVELPSGYTLLPEGSIASFPAANFSIVLHVTKGTTTSLKNIPPEVVDVMPSDTTKILSFKLTPIVFFGRDISDISSAKSGISGIARSITSFLTIGGYTGWSCLGSDVVELANNDVMLIIFLKEL